MRESLKAAIREAVTVPAYIREAATACAADLLGGPQFARKPESGSWDDFGEDDWGPLAEDLDGEISQVYTGPVGKMLRDFIQELPSSLYADEDQDSVMTDEPQGEEVDGEWYEPGPYYEIGSREIVEALFGETIAREFR
jgi:hypothetical protein